MSLFTLFRRGSAPIARERLQILLAHERIERGRPDLLGILHEEILAVIRRHVAFDPDRLQIKMDRGSSITTLIFDLEIPNGAAGVMPHLGGLVSAPARDGLSRMNRKVA